jgi:hypothetical protein
MAARCGHNLATHQFHLPCKYFILLFVFLALRQFKTIALDAARVTDATHRTVVGGGAGRRLRLALKTAQVG